MMNFDIKNNKILIFKKLVFILILFAFFNTKVYAATISFESHGGPDVASYDISTDTLGILPSPTMDGYVLDGWYKESTYENKVSSKTEVTGNMTLHAKWVVNQFPYVYSYHEKPYVCTGSNYINTGVKLYTGDTATEEGTWTKDYEIGFIIEEYDPNIQNEEQVVFMNTKYENQAAGWPGLVVRKSAQKIEITQTVNSGKVQKYVSDLTFPMQIKIIRKNNTVYYQVNGGNLYTVQSMGNFTKYFDVPVYFCAGDDGNNGTQRHLIGTISNYYVRMGTYENTTEHTVTYPDGSVEVHGHKELVDIGRNDGPADIEETVATFKYNNGDSDTTSMKTKTTVHNGFYVDSVHYDSDASLLLDDDKVVELDDDVTITGSIAFPADPVKDHYRFDGWYDENDVQYTSYNGDSDLTLYAHWTLDVSDELESNTYSVETIDNDKIVTGSEPGVIVGTYKSNMSNPAEFVKIYELNSELTNNIVIKTGLTIKLVVEGTIYDTATIVVRGDIDGDGYSNITDSLAIKDHLVGTTLINDNIRYVAANVEQDIAIRESDHEIINNYIREDINSLN